MSYFYKHITRKDLLEAIDKTPTGAQAALSLNIPVNSFRRLCSMWNVPLKKNKGRKGIERVEIPKSRDGIRKRLLKIRGNKCECCGIEEWLEHPIVVEVHHIKDRKDNSPENILLLCPNCHSQTDSWRRKGFKHD